MPALSDLTQMRGNTCSARLGALLAKNSRVRGPWRSEYQNITCPDMDIRRSRLRQRHSRRVKYVDVSSRYCSPGSAPRPCAEAACSIPYGKSQWMKLNFGPEYVGAQERKDSWRISDGVGCRGIL